MPTCLHRSTPRVDVLPISLSHGDNERGRQGLFRISLLIRIVECAVTLHCQVRAQSAAEARDRVEGIPNLIEWKEISAKELADVVKAETAINETRELDE
jgi:hypothetical protein